ncbi:MAG: hypothetical protein JXA03_00510, partial [Bacteroidales bacterium]|nr:hypothetical protein [Bacteroidales bacterium]
MKKYLILLLSLSIFASGIHGQCNFNNNSISPENYSSALGTENTSTGLSSFAAGSLNVSDDMYSTSLGYHNTASGQVSFAAGGYVSATGTYSIGIGDYLEAAGTNSIVIGTGAGTTNRLVNYNHSSLMIGFGSNKPTFFVGTAASSTKTGKIGIGDMTDPQAKLHIKTDL